MSNSGEEISIQEMSEALKYIREKVKELRARVPNLRNLNSMDEISSEEDLDFFHRVTAVVFFYFMGDAYASPHFSPIISAEAEDAEIFEWREKELLPILKKMRALVQKKMGLSASQVQWPDSQFQPAVDGLLKYMDEHHAQLEKEGVKVERLGQLLTRPYFDPGAWGKNERALFPIVTKRDIGKIPMHILERLTEVYRSFVFGNWIAAVALSRCLLEYAIVEQGDVLGIDVYETRKKKWVRRFVDFIKRVALGEVSTDEKKRVRRLVDLIKDVKKTRPKLAPRMNQIRNAGNRVMHPPKKNEERKLPGEDDAKKCYDNIREIITVLYGK